MQESWSAAICLDTGLTLIWWDANYKHLQLYFVQVQSMPGPVCSKQADPCDQNETYHTSNEDKIEHMNETCKVDEQSL